MTQPFPVWVIHSPKLERRKAECLASLATLGWSARWLETQEPRDLGWGFWVRNVRNPRLTWAQISVYAKHKAVLGHIALEGRPALVLEDDPVFAADFGQRAEAYFTSLPVDWDFVFLGASSGLERSPDPATPLFAQTSSTRSMSGYLVTPEAARRAYGALKNRAIRRPIDLTLNAVLAELGLRVFWSVPALIQNGSETGRYPRSIVSGKWRALNPARFLRRWKGAAFRPGARDGNRD